MHDDVDRAILEVLAVTFEAIPRTTIARIISAGRMLSGTLKPDVLVARLSALTAAGALVDLGTRWSVAPTQLHDITLQIARSGRLDALAAAVSTAMPPQISSTSPYGTWHDGMRKARFALYAGRWPEAQEALRSVGSPWTHIAPAVPPAWIDALPLDLQASALTELVHVSTVTLTPCPAWRPRLDALPVTALSDNQLHHRVGRMILEGRLDEARALASTRTGPQSQVDLAWLTLASGDVPGAVAAYEVALTAYLKMAGKRAKFFPDRGGVFFVVALLADGQLERAGVLAKAACTKGISALPHGHDALSWVATSLTEPDTETWMCPTPSDRWDPTEHLVHALAQRWLGLPKPKGLADLSRRAAATGLRWLAEQLARCDGGAAPTLGIDLSACVRRPDRNDKALRSLEALAGLGAAPAGAVAEAVVRDVRLIWVLADAGHIALEPREQVRGKGGWSKGRAVALKRLAEEASGMEHLSAADRAAVACISTTVSTGRYRDVSYNLDTDRALLALIGAPNVFAAAGDAPKPVQVRRVEAALQVEKTKAGFRFALTHTPTSEDDTCGVTRPERHQVDVAVFTPTHLAVAAALGKKPLIVPHRDQDRVRALLTALSARLPVQADLGGPAEAQPADARPIVELRRRGPGLSLDLTVRPLGEAGPRLRAGSGPARVWDEAGLRRVTADRDLAAELGLAQALRDACPTLTDANAQVFTERDAALQVLSELTGAAARIVWPDGDPIELTELGVDALRLRLAADGDAFTVDGTLAHVELRQLLDYLSASPGRFFGDGAQLIAITADLRRRLDELRELSHGAGLRYHPLRLPIVAELLTGAATKADKAWTAAVARLTTTGDPPAVPSTLRAELRPYQADGFQWLARLGRWGVGGCLADDMGLGKTVQLLALLLHRAAEGPSLVVAPTSVLSTWADEIARWAPSLRVRALSGPRREGALRDLGPFDLVLTSYAILTLEAEALAAVPFVVAALDEAQQIKNGDTARAHAAFGLRAAQRAVTTGTPVENRLSDLWSLFRFLNPGLLGSAESFERRFSRPIERAHDAAARARLRRLLAPFLLRRTKGEVLPEVPSRTEVILPVTLGPDEIALYEAIRVDLLDQLGRGDGAQRFYLLAGIMKLRRAASHMRMVLPDAGPDSSKLEALTELLEEVVPRGHKALVFSQFVDHLQLARAALPGLRSQYLDGSTPAAARKAAIDAFQAGDGDVFFISLKAGGFGLNLTAADYVIHLDPWWNPAAEDQASDRSHRMGQTRPVTVYRLIARDTVEDRIVALHHRKRELASSLLEGADAVGALSEAELLDLLRPMDG